MRGRLEWSSGIELNPVKHVDQNQTFISFDRTSYAQRISHWIALGREEQRHGMWMCVERKLIQTPNMILPAKRTK